MIFVMNAIAVIFIVLGLFFFLGTSIGLIRFPDFYTRIHAAGKGDTLSTLLIVLGLVFYNLRDIQHLSLENLFVTMKVVVVWGLIFIGSPTATHAIVHAAYRLGAKFWQIEEKADD